ncbi:MAG: ribonuclease HI [Minisyncoccia bacterium]
MPKTLKIYTDGAARSNPGRAGWGVVFILGSKIFEIGGGADYATNNQMELTAAIEALKYIKKHKLKASLEIFSDSKYVILGITEWIFNWQKNNWRNAGRKPVLNRELWEELFILTEEFKPKWRYVKGHAENAHNNRADEIATNLADGNKIEMKEIF